MSDYWKSTPKYWCKHCGVYVRDTKLERTNHEATGKHKSNLNKFLRNIHRDKEQEQRDKQRAKDEVARLNGLPLTKDEDRSRKVSHTTGKLQHTRQASVDERRQQIEELAKLGVAIPDEYRQGLAMVSEWRAVPQASQDTATQGKFRDSTGSNPIAGQTYTSFKRKAEEASTLESEAERPRKVAWGSATKKFGDAKANTDGLDALLLDVQNNNDIKSEDNEGIAPSAHSQALEITTKMDECHSVGPAKSVDDEEQIIFKKRRSRGSKR